MPSNPTEAVMLALGAALMLVAAPYIILASMPIIGFSLHVLQIIGVLGHG